MSLEFALSVRSRNFYFFSVPEGGKGLCFCCVFRPRFREGNPGPHSTRFNYSSFYGSLVKESEMLWVDATSGGSDPQC